MDGQIYPMASRFPSRERLLGAVLIALTFILLAPESTSAHGVVGNRIFLSPIVGNDAFPDNAFNSPRAEAIMSFHCYPNWKSSLATVLASCSPEVGLG